MPKWVDAAESDLDCVFQVNCDLIGITQAIHIMEEDTIDADDSDTDTVVDDDNTQSDILLDDLLDYFFIKNNWYNQVKLVS